MVPIAIIILETITFIQLCPNSAQEKISKGINMPVFADKIGQMILY